MMMARSTSGVLPFRKHRECSGVHLAATEALNRFLERARACASNDSEQRHARVELHVIRRAENRVQRSSCVRQDQARALLKPRPKHRVGKVGSRLRARGNPEGNCGWRATQASQLRKDEPHPVAFLLAGPQLVQHSGIDRALSVNKAVKVDRVHGGLPDLGGVKKVATGQVALAQCPGVIAICQRSGRSQVIVGPLARFDPLLRRAGLDPALCSAEPLS